MSMRVRDEIQEVLRDCDDALSERSRTTCVQAPAPRRRIIPSPKDHVRLLSALAVKNRCSSGRQTPTIAWTIGVPPLTNTLEYVGDGYRVSLLQSEGGWDDIICSSWHRDVSSARDQAAKWSAENANCAIREIGTDRKGRS
jgi:hypothetical protein